MILRSNATGWNDNLLIWEHEIGKLLSTRDSEIEWYVHGKLVQTFTVQSVLQAILAGKAEIVPAKKDRDQFRYIKFTDLVTV